MTVDEYSLDLIFSVIQILAFRIDYVVIKKYVEEHKIKLVFDENIDKYFDNLVGKYYHIAVMLYAINEVDADYIMRFCKREYGKYIDSKRGVDILNVQIPNMKLHENIILAYYFSKKQGIQIETAYDSVLEDLVASSMKCIKQQRKNVKRDERELESLQREYIVNEIGKLSSINSFKILFDKFTYTAQDDDVFELIKEKKALVEMISSKLTNKCDLKSDKENLNSYVIEKIASNDEENYAIERIIYAQEKQYRGIIKVMNLFRNALEYSNISEKCFYEFNINIVDRVVESWCDDVDIDYESVVMLIVFDCLLRTIKQMK